MNIQTVITNLLNTIEGKEQMRDRYVELATDSSLSHHSQSTAATMVGVLNVNLEELNNILNDCMAVREADIVKNLELEDLKRKSIDDSWALNPERMGR